MRARGVRGILVLAMCIGPPSARAAPNVCCGWSGGADLSSSVVWRGVEYTRAPALQPWIAADAGPLGLEADATAAVDGSWGEGSMLAGLGAAGRFGRARLLVESHVFSGSELDYASPVTEAGLEYATPRVPLRVQITRNVVHDREHATQATMSVARERTALSVALFGTVALNASDYYDAGAGEVLQYGITVERELAAFRRVGAVIALTALHSPAHAQRWLVGQVGVFLPREP